MRGHRHIIAVVASALLVAGCGGDEEKSDAEKANDVATRYVHTHSNKEEASCRATLASGVDPQLCDDLGPLVSRNDPEVETEARITGTTAKVTVTGAGPTLIDVDLRKQGDDWKVVKWRGYKRP